MSQTRAILTLSVLLTLAGCAVGYNSTLFLTQSNIGLDVETKPPTAEISISRQEGVIAPGFEGGQTPPVIAGFQTHEDPFSRFFFGVQSTFAGGDAALALSQGPGGSSTGQDSGLCLSQQPDSRQFLFWDLSVPKKGGVVPFFFATDTVFGLKLAWTGTAGPYPDSLRLGFNRKESAWAPLFGTDVAHCNIPGTTTPGSYIVWMPAFLAVLDANGEAGQPSQTGVKWLQYFATGTSATTLANWDDVRRIMLKQAFPAAVGTFDKDPTTYCILNWLNTPEHGKTLADWWSEQRLPGNAAVGIIQKEYGAQRKEFMKKENISCTRK